VRQHKPLNIVTSAPTFDQIERRPDKRSHRLLIGSIPPAVEPPDGCLYGQIDGGDTSYITSGNNFPSAVWNTGITAATLNSAIYGTSGTGLLTIFFCGMVEPTVCQVPILPSGTAWITACVDFLTSGGTIVVVTETTVSCMSGSDVTAVNDFLTDIGSALQIDSASISSNTGDQLVTGPSPSARKVLEHELTRNACKLGHGGGGSVLNGTTILQGIADTGGGGTVAVIAEELLYLDAMNPTVAGRVIVVADANFFNSTVSNRLNSTFMANLCGFTPCGLTRWIAASKGYTSSGIYTDGSCSTTLTFSFNDWQFNHAYSGTGASLAAAALSDNAYRWDMQTVGNGGVYSFCIKFTLNMNTASSTYVDGGGDAICPRIAACVLHDSTYYTTIDDLSLTVQPDPTGTSTGREYTIGPVYPSDLAAISGWLGSGASPAITTSIGTTSTTRYVRFGLAFLYEDADDATVSRLAINSATLFLDCNCA
jgi:hypothetical protein